MKRVNWVCSALAPLLSLSACSYTALGPAFRAAPIAPNTSIIYLYRPNVLRNAGVAMPLFVDDLPVGAFFSGGYVPFHVQPGRHTVKMVIYGQERIVTLTTQPNSESYVKYYTHFSGTELQVVSQNDGRADIADCKLLPGGYDARDRQ